MSKVSQSKIFQKKFFVDSSQSKFYFPCSFSISTNEKVFKVFFFVRNHYTTHRTTLFHSNLAQKKKQNNIDNYKRGFEKNLRFGISLKYKAIIFNSLFSQTHLLDIVNLKLTAVILKLKW